MYVIACFCDFHTFLNLTCQNLSLSPYDPKPEPFILHLTYQRCMNFHFGLNINSPKNHFPNPHKFTSLSLQCSNCALLPNSPHHLAQHIPLDIFEMLEASFWPKPSQTSISSSNPQNFMFWASKYQNCVCYPHSLKLEPNILHLMYLSYLKPYLSLSHNSSKGVLPKPHFSHL